MRILYLALIYTGILNVSYGATIDTQPNTDDVTEGYTYTESSTQDPAVIIRPTVSSIEKNVFLVENREYWTQLGKKGIEDALKVKHNNGIAKNVILFVGDGMGLATVVASRIYKGQLNNKPGEEGYLAFEDFPNVGLLKTYTIDKQVPDSAGTASALFSGIKARSKTVGFDSTVTPNTCDPEVQKNAKVTTVIDWAIKAKKSTGLVTTTRITHATPSAAYAHSTHRDWECDKNIPKSERQFNCKDIARQLVEEEPGLSINVILGGGLQQFRAGVNVTTSCYRTDNKDLVWDWMQYQKGQNKTNVFVDTKKSLEDVDENKIERLFGLFAPDHIPYDKDRNMTEDGEPSLEDMTRKALKILKKNKNGFVLLVEGGRIDHAHHDNLAKVALEEAVALEKAIITAYNMTSEKDTLIIVTADHSHSFTINGYPARGNPIGGLSDVTKEGFPYQTLSYMNGPGYIYHRMNDTDALNNDTLKRSHSINTWRNLNKTAEDNANRKTRHFAAYWNKDETHGGEDVPVYASGPMGHLFHGVHEQTHVAFTMAYSACIGPYAGNCRSGTAEKGKSSASDNSQIINWNFIFLVISYQIVHYLFQ